MTDCHHLRSELGAYVLEALEPDEVEAVRAHLDTCAACQAELARLAGLPAMLTLAEGLEETPAPPPGIEERVLDAVAREQSRAARPPRAPRRRLALLRPRSLAFGGVAAAVLAAVVLALALRGDGPATTPGYEIPLKPVAMSGASGSATLHSVAGGTTLHLAADDLAGDPSIVYEVYCDNGDKETASAGTFRADAAGHAYAVLQTALRRGEYDGIRVVRKQRDARGRVRSREVLEAHLPSS